MMTLENLKKNFENLGREEIISALYDLAYEYDVEYLLDDIVSEDLIDELTKNALENRGWQGVATFLSKIKHLNDEYYCIDGYGNLEEVSYSYLKCLLSDLETEVKAR